MSLESNSMTSNIMSKDIVHVNVALVGRPNVGKSSLFNYLTRTRDAVVKDEPGVTRDIKMGVAEWWGKTFNVFDTGGITDATEGLFEVVKKQVLLALDQMDAIIFIMDGRQGLSPDDKTLLQIIKKSGKPFKAVINKIDKFEDTDLILSEFYELGLDDFTGISVEHQDGIDTIIEWVSSFEKEQSFAFAENRIRVSIVGKPNVGKSSLVNMILGEEKQVVFDQPGTTVDFVDHNITINDQDYKIIDTAGLRRQSKREDGIEYLSAVKSYTAINRSDVVLLVVDAQEGPTRQDAKIVEYLLEKHKAVVMVLNKSDLAKDKVQNYQDQLAELIQKEFHFFKDIRTVFTSAVTGQGLNNLFRMIDKTWKDLNIKIPTSQLNKFFTETIRLAPSPVWGSKNVKLYYLTQTQQRPPSFIAFANHPQGVTPAYRRFLVNKIKERWDIPGVPVRIFAMKSGGKAL